MKIRQLTVRNFRGLIEQTVDFTDADGNVRPLTVIVGPNRSGKTTLLDALHLVYSQVNAAPQPEMQPLFGTPAPSRQGLADPRLRPDPNKPIEIELAFALDEPDEWDALGDVASALQDDAPVPAEAPKLRFQLPNPDGSIKGVLEQSPRLASRGLRGRSEAGTAIARRVIDHAIFDRIGGLLYLDQNRTIDPASALARPASADQLARAATAGDILPWIELQARLAVRWDPDKKGPSGWSRLRDLFARLARPATIDDMEPFPEGYDLLLRDTHTDRRYSLAGASSGERMMLRLAASLTAFGHRRSVVLIDEVELHLHPRWQRNLLHFCKLGADGDTQFIVTTHSDTIMRYVDPAAVVSLGDLDE